MKKALEEMTLEELWQLFPIILAEHDSRWAEWYAEEESRIKSLLPFDVKIYHIGSTAVKHIMAKPIVDILLTTERDRLKRAAEILRRNGYIVMSSSENRISLNRGYTENGFAEKVFHVHLRLEGDADEVLFRDYLNAHPDVAAEYESLKLRLREIYEFDRDAYTDAKSEFVGRHTEAAKLEFARR